LYSGKIKIGAMGKSRADITEELPEIAFLKQQLAKIKWTLRTLIMAKRIPIP